MTIYAYVAIMAASMLSFVLGLWARPFLSKFSDVNDFALFMDRIVNQEEADERRNLIRMRLHDAGRRTMRLDGGQPAKVHRMRRVRRIYRDQLK
jgi:hypothetical protein